MSATCDDDVAGRMNSPPHGSRVSAARASAYGSRMARLGELERTRGRREAQTPRAPTTMSATERRRRCPLPATTMSATTSLRSGSKQWSCHARCSRSASCPPPLGLQRHTAYTVGTWNATSSTEALLRGHQGRRRRLTSARWSHPLRTPPESPPAPRGGEHARNPCSSRSTKAAARQQQGSSSSIKAARQQQQQQGSSKAAKQQGSKAAKQQSSKAAKQR